MPTMIPYLFFDGNCEEAMMFYEKCFDGKLTLNRASEAPESAHLPEEKKTQIMHASLAVGKVILEASDVLNDMEVSHGNSIRLNYDLDNLEELNKVFNRLSQGGTVESEVKKEFWGGYYGTLTDKFGFRWMLTCSS